jgi:Cysteine sulfinate desulfinase/cysteine desulfurase and related enzymes
MSEPPIYLDHNATTPIDPRVVEAMTRAWRDCGANPASQHGPGRRARRMLEEAREGIAELLGAKTGGMDADRVIFTSGGTEANNLALLGYILPDDACAVLCISPFEHPSVRMTADILRRQQKNVVTLQLDEAFCQEQLAMAESNDCVCLVSYMLANNETGIVHPLEEIVQACRSFLAFIHTDAVQAVGKIRVNFRELGVDAMTVAPHKFHGPLGIGALVLKHGVKLQPQLTGGFQQEGMRPGTENVALAVGFRESLKIAVAELPERAERMRVLRDELEQQLMEFGRQEACPTVVIGQDSPRLPNTSCISFPGVDRQALVMALDIAGVACSTGSACASGSSEPSPTLVAMGLSKEVIAGAIRLSLGAFTGGEEIAEAARRIIKAVNHLRSRKSG